MSQNDSSHINSAEANAILYKHLRISSNDIIDASTAREETKLLLPIVGPFYDVE
jgi:hypothetical protein